LVFALAAATAVFFLVPRGVSLGEIKVHSERMAWNISGGSYALNLKARIPIYNPNYLNVSSWFLLTDPLFARFSLFLPTKNHFCRCVMPSKRGLVREKNSLQTLNPDPPLLYSSLLFMGGCSKEILLLLSPRLHLLTATPPSTDLSV